MGLYKIIREKLQAGRPVTLLTVIGSQKETGFTGGKVLFDDSAIIWSTLNRQNAEFLHDAVTGLDAYPDSALIELEVEGMGVLELFILRYKTSPRLIILGGGHVGAALCRIAAHLDFEIILVDDRPAFAGPGSHPQAHRLICDRFETALDQIEAFPSDFIVIVTRGHKHDRLCLEKSLRRQPAYLGMIGSKKRVRSQMEDLIRLGYSETDLARVHSPIGLSIGAVTETEIAVSILAEIIKVRRQGSKDETIQTRVLDSLVALEEENKWGSLATIVKTAGSTPRKAGSQILFFPDGSCVGTIGGGCSEAEVRREALDRFSEPPAVRMRLELTADAAADEGMACGGIMDIFLEKVPS